MIIREKYLEKIRPYYDKRIIKIINGVRRSGKSTLLNQIIDELLELNVDSDHIYMIDFDNYSNNIYTNSAKINNYLKSIIKDNEMYYLFFDEVQNLNDWGKILGLYNITNRLSIFVTGSNSDLFKTRDINYITQYKTFTLFPLSYKEICELNNYNKGEYLNNYLKWGGMPQCISIDNNFKKTYINDVYNSIIVKDIVNRFNVKDIELLNKIINYILMNISEQFSVTNMTKYFETYDRKVSLDTIYNYLEYIDKSFMLQKLERYSVKEDRILSGKYKYYVTDFNFFNIIDVDIELKYRLENLVYMELISRGYDVKQAVIGSKEIDFIAIKDNKKMYIEVYDTLNDDMLREKAFKKYNRIDSTEKYIFTLDDIDYSTKTVKHVNILKFLDEEIF